MFLSCFVSYIYLTAQSNGSLLDLFGWCLRGLVRHKGDEPQELGKKSSHKEY